MGYVVDTETAIEVYQYRVTDLMCVRPCNESRNHTWLGIFLALISPLRRFGQWTTWRCSEQEIDRGQLLVVVNEHDLLEHDLQRSLTFDEVVDNPAGPVDAYPWARFGYMHR